MKNQIKSTVKAIATLVASAPALVSAQLDTSAGGSTNLPGGSVMSIIIGIMNWLLAAIGIAGVIGFAIAGILYLTAAGDDTRIGQAKNAMTYSIIGVIVALAGVVALQFAKGMLGAETGY
jgi:hypothetical protein